MWVLAWPLGRGGGPEASLLGRRARRREPRRQSVRHKEEVAPVFIVQRGTNSSENLRRRGGVHTRTTYTHGGLPHGIQEPCTTPQGSSPPEGPKVEGPEGLVADARARVVWSLGVRLPGCVGLAPCKSVGVLLTRSEEMGRDRANRDLPGMRQEGKGGGAPTRRPMV